MTNFGVNIRNFVRSSDPDADLGLYLQSLAEEISALQDAAVRSIPRGYQIEIRERGPAIVDTFNNRVAYLPWEPDND